MHFDVYEKEHFTFERDLGSHFPVGKYLAVKEVFLSFFRVGKSVPNLSGLCFNVDRFRYDVVAHGYCFCITGNKVVPWDWPVRMDALPRKLSVNL